MSDNAPTADTIAAGLRAALTTMVADDASQDESPERLRLVARLIAISDALRWIEGVRA